MKNLKDVIKVGTVVILKEGSKAVVLIDAKDKLFFEHSGGTYCISDYLSDGTSYNYNDCHSIVEVYGVSTKRTLQAFCDGSNNYRASVWKKEEVKTVVTMDEIARKFGVDVANLTIKKED